MARILCIEDSNEFKIYLSSILSEHTLTHVSTLRDALRALQGGRSSFDLVLLDVSLPDGNSMKLIPKFKEALPNKVVPIIIVSSDNDLLTKVAAFGMGADDYVSKPPEASELKARIQARLRAADTLKKGTQSLLEYGGIAIDMERMSVEVIQEDGSHKLLELTPFEFKVLKLLIGRPGQVFSRDNIIERVWGVGRFVSARTVDAHVSHLRRKMMGSKIQIETVLTAGYKISVLKS